MHKSKDFWNLLELLWLQRLAVESLWKYLHKEELGIGVEIFDPFTTN